MQATAERRAARRAASAPERRCIASGQVRPKEELLRFVVGPDATLVLDPAARLPGRGLWLSPRRDMIEKACARNLFAKAAKAEIRLPPDLLEQTERVLRRRCLDLIGLARRAGQTAAGFEQVRDRLAAGGAALLIQARDAADNGRHKVAALAKATNPAMPIVAPFSAEELGRALGRGPTVHLLFLPGTLAERLKVEVARLAAIADEAGCDRGKLDS
jgi:predicted RNA-binding protein YlxR (DUF448 family)